MDLTSVRLTVGLLQFCIVDNADRRRARKPKRRRPRAPRQGQAGDSYQEDTDTSKAGSPQLNRRPSG